MGKNDYCAVYGCSNGRNSPDKLIIMSHVGILRWHSPKTEKDAKSLEKALNRGGKFKISMSTKVCSNHFAAGYCSDICRIPTLYMKGYQSNPTKRSLPTERSSLLPPPKARQVFRDGSDDLNLCDVPSQTPFLNGHDYDNAIDNEQCSRSKIYENCDSCTSKQNKTVTIIRQQIKNKLKRILHTNLKILGKNCCRSHLVEQFRSFQNAMVGVLQIGI
ncbi:uncharacterized protein LOC130641670 [Hydractinia symbiolongicarpus]|uniref:uncharacterized protein LOC130641659 n=1 Tax=Hydractinia symbiolongicarpus TaxID=13093 RepID=UPI00254A82ED|nr:uncharacterized protein LOC130641659 [Hydractinia symbiolongicarpus]XP_057304562.1 uncharacterized protein LOC130641669 [Hydractinia symbiolongicarpus]XP_057304563.1 uncharacterized protein LOC130641670 [Hydractinia symbiolongicarpus]